MRRTILVSLGLTALLGATSGCSERPPVTDVPVDSGTPDSDSGAGTDVQDAGSLDVAETDTSTQDSANDVTDLDTPDSSDAGEDVMATDASNPDASDATSDVPRVSGFTCMGDAGVEAGVRIRVAAANITSGTQQSYEPPGIRIFQGIRPDIVMIQEFRYLGGPLRDFVNLAFGTSFDFFVESPANTGIPNGIISRYPILASGEWEDTRTPDRDIAWARIDVPGPKDLWAISVHLTRTSVDARNQSANELLALIAANIPPTDYLVVGGDLNTNVESELVLTTFATALTVGPPYPIDELGNNRTSGNRGRPYDWVLARPNLSQLEIPLQIADRCYNHGLVFDSQVYTPLVDVAPVVASDSASVNMQHMLVARDYLLPSP